MQLEFMLVLKKEDCTSTLWGDVAALEGGIAGKAYRPPPRQVENQWVQVQ